MLVSVFRHDDNRTHHEGYVISVVHLEFTPREELLPKRVGTWALGVAIVVVNYAIKLFSFTGCGNLQVFFKTSGLQPISFANSSPLLKRFIRPRPT